MKIRDIALDSLGAQVLLDGKTGPRRIRVVGCVPMLTEWLNWHPQARDRNSFIWVKRGEGRTVLTQSRVRYILEHLRAAAGISKPANAHHFRHSRATFLASFLTEAQMNIYFGWIQGSKMAGVYVHMSGRDVDSAILRLHGLQPQTPEQSEETSVKPCVRCHEANAFMSIYCSRCGLPLDEKAAAGIIREDAQRKESEMLLTHLMADEETRAAMRATVASLRLGRREPRRIGTAGAPG